MDEKRKAALLASLRRENNERAKTYREQALKLFPHVCQRCGREFSGTRLRELTVHHKDGNHMNNPPDGSNWALLCLYCHDDEHGTAEQRGVGPGGTTGNAPSEPLGFQAFEGLRELLVNKDEKPQEQ
jgi:hypothetical protein